MSNDIVTVTCPKKHYDELVDFKDKISKNYVQVGTPYYRGPGTYLTYVAKDDVIKQVNAIIDYDKDKYNKRVIELEDEVAMLKTTVDEESQEINKLNRRIVMLEQANKLLQSKVKPFWSFLKRK